ncbi:uncharacterized protein G2W53_028525 [Senna tora]|uniref:Uncharacterized protein n=1 Tax=Senna tora TaxID=362788 RepID=A0A834T3F0_9FABA|nr:uncharacterized protein G2W53_028525 [Senna tora]
MFCACFVWLGFACFISACGFRREGRWAVGYFRRWQARVAVGSFRHREACVVSGVKVAGASSEGVSTTRWPKRLQECLQRCFGHLLAETPLQALMPVPAWARAPNHGGLLIWSYDLYGIPDVQPHAYMRGVMIGHDACGIVAKNKKVLAMDFLFVADAFLVVMAAWRESTVKRRTYLVHSREKLASRSPPLRLQHEVQVGLEHALEGLEHALGVLHSQSTTCWTLAGGRSWGTQDPLTAIYIRTRRKRPGGRTVWS